jgi:hypothetical protein
MVMNIILVYLALNQKDIMLIMIDLQIKDFGMIALTMTNPSHFVELVAIIKMALQKEKKRSYTWCSNNITSRKTNAS